MICILARGRSTSNLQGTQTCIHIQSGSERAALAPNHSYSFMMSRCARTRGLQMERVACGVYQKARANLVSPGQSRASGSRHLMLQTSAFLPPISFVIPCQDCEAGFARRTQKFLLLCN